MHSLCIHCGSLFTQLKSARHHPGCCTPKPKYLSVYCCCGYDLEPALVVVKNTSEELFQTPLLTPLQMTTGRSIPSIKSWCFVLALQLSKHLFKHPSLGLVKSCLLLKKHSKNNLGPFSHASNSVICGYFLICYGCRTSPKP